MTKETKEPTTEELKATVRDANHALNELRGAIADAQTRSASPVGVVVKEPQEQREGREQAEKLEKKLPDAERALAVAQASWHARVTAERQPGRLDCLRSLRDALRVTHDVGAALWEYDEQTGRVLGRVPLPVVGPTPAQFDDHIAAVQREIDGPPPKAPAPGPKSGEVRVRLPQDGVLDTFFDRDAEYGGHYYARGDVFDIPRRGVRDLLKTGALVEIEAGA